MPVFHLNGISADPDGVIWYRDEDLGRSVWVRVQPAEDGRWQVTELLLPNDERPVTTDDLRRVPLGRIEAYANGPEAAAILSVKAASEPVSLEERVRQAEQQGQELTARAVARRRRHTLHLNVPPNRPYPDAFYERVARVYAQVAAEERRPAASIAEASDVPVTTVHRWVKECRARGLLPPGRVGKAG